MRFPRLENLVRILLSMQAVDLILEQLQMVGEDVVREGRQREVAPAQPPNNGIELSLGRGIDINLCPLTDRLLF